MTTGEAQSVFLAGLPGAAADLGLDEYAVAAKLKLLAALPEASSQGARHVIERFHLDPNPWHRRPVVSHDDVRVLAQAVWQTRRLRIRYESWNGVSTCVIEPLGIVLKAGEWYFVAKRRGHAVIHKLTKTTELTLLEETFEYPAAFDLEKAWREAVSAFEVSLRKATARIRVSGRALSRLDRLGADMAEPVLAAKPDADGWREAVVSIENVGHAAGLILGFADEIKVLSPPELRGEIARLARSVSELYAGQGAIASPSHGVRESKPSRLR